ncbi:MAG: DUF4125 family protein [Lachnospiraceae bacterium]|nr:DUF4125 family protein [Lachnospiraceae bacterium]
MRFLVIGGTYFLGKAFVDLACEDNEIVVVNRGNRDVRFTYPGHVKTIISDRHSITAQMLNGEFDAVIDFCAYSKGDIRELVSIIHGKIKQYIFISTSDVFKRGTKTVVKESSAFEAKDFGGDAGNYILGKVALEHELLEISNEYNISVNAIRPTFIYGQDNYASRESMFFDWVEKAGQVIYPEDATGHFQMVYVEDVARIILKICGNDLCRNTCFNITGDEVITYDKFINSLSIAMNKKIERVNISVSEINEREIPLPFPLTEEESEIYTSDNIKMLDIKYTNLADGLKKTYSIRLEREVVKNVDRLFDEGNPIGALEYMTDMLAFAKNTHNEVLELTVLNELIGYYRQTSDREKLVSVINDSLSILEKMDGARSLKSTTVILNIANGYRSLSMLDEAKEKYDITYSIYEESIRDGRLERDDLLVAGLYNNYSLLCQEHGEYKVSREYLEKALNIVVRRKAGFEIAVTHANLANTCVLQNDIEAAKDYAYKAIRLFKARAYIDAHYCAALSALSTCYFKEGDYSHAKRIYREAADIVEKTIGRNSQYKRLIENIKECEEAIEKESKEEKEVASMKGLTLSKEYYEEYGKKMISDKFSEYENKIAIGLAGEGSDCFGYDDDISIDHDFGPDFCMWLTDDIYEKIGEDLRKAYNSLPKKYKGYERNVTSTGTGRRGVIKISDYFKKFVGTDNLDEIDYTRVEDYAFAAAVNGEVFRDDEGIFTSMREKLNSGYPENIRMLKIAEKAASFSQCAQYNYLRMLNREDEVTAFTMLSDGIKHAMKLYHYINNVFPPHDKWLYKSTKNIEGSEKVILLIDQITSQFVTKTDKKEVAIIVEKLGEYLATLMYDEGIISDINPYLDYHTEEIVFKASICELSVEELAKKITELEFKTFDKVQNEGGRASCQNNWPTFSIMRMSQYLTWTKEMLIQYYYDFNRECNLGHNLITEKYGRMMESTDKEAWEKIKDNFPEISEEKKAVIEQIVGIQMQMMEEFAEKHPSVADNARSLHTFDDNIYNTSYETYLRGEISTYSDKMLQLYGKYVVNTLKNGENIALKTMTNTALLYGFKSFEEFEKA